MQRWTFVQTIHHPTLLMKLLILPNGPLNEGAKKSFQKSNSNTGKSTKLLGCCQTMVLAGIVRWSYMINNTVSSHAFNQSCFCYVIEKSGLRVCIIHNFDGRKWDYFFRPYQYMTVYRRRGLDGDSLAAQLQLPGTCGAGEFPDQVRVSDLKPLIRAVFRLCSSDGPCFTEWNSQTCPHWVDIPWLWIFPLPPSHLFQQQTCKPFIIARAVSKH